MVRLGQRRAMIRLRGALSSTAVFTGPPCNIGLQENPGSAAPAQHLLGRLIAHTERDVLRSN
jgi:hypothetical protein